MLSGHGGFSTTGSSAHPPQASRGVLEPRVISRRATGPTRLQPEQLLTPGRCRGVPNSELPCAGVDGVEAEKSVPPSRKDLTMPSAGLGGPSCRTRTTDVTFRPRGTQLVAQMVPKPWVPHPQGCPGEQGPLSLRLSLGFV